MEGRTNWKVETDVYTLLYIRERPGGPGFDPWVGKTLGEGNSYPLQYSGLENSMNYPSMGSQRVGHD